MEEGPSYFEMSDVLKARTRYQYFCPMCKHGPFFTGSEITRCPACDKKMILRKIEGDIIVEGVPAKPKRP